MKKLLVLFAVLPFVFVSCNKGMEISSEPKEIVFDAEDEFTLTTKAVTEVTTSNLSTIKVSATTGTAGSESAASSFDNVTFTKQTSGTNSGKFTGGKYWPSSNPSYHFYASNVAMTFAAGGTTVAPTATTTDIVCGYLASPTYNTQNTITMNHIFGRIGTCSVSSKDGYSISNVSVKITPNIPKSAGGTTYNIRTGTWSGTQAGTATEIANTSGSSKNNDFLLCPGTYTLTVGWTATKDNYSKTFSNKTSSSFSVPAGQTTNISLSAGGDATEIVFSVNVTAWSTNNVSPTLSI